MELYHHGILGQKWGIRRYQNKDGSLTAEGIKRYRTDLKFKEKYDKYSAKQNEKKATKAREAEVKRVEKLMNKDTRKLTAEELAERIQRLNMEKSVSALEHDIRIMNEAEKNGGNKQQPQAKDKAVSAGKKVVGDLLNQTTGVIVKGIAGYVGSKVLNKMFGGDKQRQQTSDINKAMNDVLNDALGKQAKEHEKEMKAKEKEWQHKTDAAEKERQKQEKKSKNGIDPEDVWEKHGKTYDDPYDDWHKERARTRSERETYVDIEPDSVRTWNDSPKHSSSYNDYSSTLSLGNSYAQKLLTSSSVPHVDVDLFRSSSNGRNFTYNQQSVKDSYDYGKNYVTGLLETTPIAGYLTTLDTKKQ